MGTGTFVLGFHSEHSSGNKNGGGATLRKDFYHITVVAIPLFRLPRMNVMDRISRHLPTHLRMNTDSATGVKWVGRTMK